MLYAATSVGRSSTARIKLLRRASACIGDYLDVNDDGSLQTLLRGTEMRLQIVQFKVVSPHDPACA
ncbi:hypothetical protein A3216_04390 [Mycobacterium leprae 7935681]|nr:hypothetical protein A3216_04390 [Mycobacterium leprae 7935681]